MISLLYARLRQTKTHQGEGFALMKNGAIFELCFENETIANAWEQALKNVCVMTNFHEEYHGLDVLGEGSFARVRGITEIHAIYCFRCTWFDQKSPRKSLLQRSFSKKK